MKKMFNKRILIDIGHPAHVHLFRYTYHQLLKDGYKVWITVKDIPVVKMLLDNYNMEYIVLGEKKDSLIAKIITQINYNLKIYKLVKKENINIGIGSSITLAHVSRVTKMKSIILDDDDDDVQPLFVRYAHPFADTLLSPESLIGHRAKKETIFYSSFHELAYLHPKLFKPNIDVLKEIGLKKNQIFFILRFNVFKAHHDVGVNGMSLSQKLQLIKVLEQYGKILITTEREIEPELKQYQLLISPDKIHSLLYYATMFLGDSQTMTSEAAVLGTPAIRMNSLVGKIAYLEEEEHKYSLIYGFKPNQFDSMVLKINELLRMNDIKFEWKKRRKKLLCDKINATSFFVWFIENYPKSIEIMKKDPNYQLSFK
jgi:uncharacterized protein